MRNRLFLIIFLLLLFNHNSYCQSSTGAPASTTQQDQKKDSSSTYYNDPFSEIETAEDEEYEEALDRFYTFGRILHLAFYGQLINPLGPMQDLYSSGFIFGGRVSYFIDWDVAITLHFSLGKLNLQMPNLEPSTKVSVPTITGSALLGSMGFGLKYYVNFYDISKPISYLNPAIFAGVEMTVLKDTVDDALVGVNQTTQTAGPLYGKINGDLSHQSIAPGMYFGASFEFPIFRKSIYLGFEFIYHMTFFPATNPNVASDINFKDVDYSGHLMSYGMQLIWNL